MAATTKTITASDLPVPAGPENKRARSGLDPAAQQLVQFRDAARHPVACEAARYSEATSRGKTFSPPVVDGYVMIAAAEFTPRYLMTRVRRRSAPYGRRQLFETEHTMGDAVHGLVGDVGGEIVEQHHRGVEFSRSNADRQDLPPVAKRTLPSSLISDRLSSTTRLGARARRLRISLGGSPSSRSDELEQALLLLGISKLSGGSSSKPRCRRPATSRANLRPSRNSRSVRAGWCWTACPRSGCWRRVSLRYRRQILAIKHYFAKFNTTVMLLDDLTADVADKTDAQRRPWCAPSRRVGAGPMVRNVAVPASSSNRGVNFRGGYHDVTITTGGLNVFPRLVPRNIAAASHATGWRAASRNWTSLLGGGVETGSSTLILGPAGTGKSLAVIVFVVAAIKRGEKAALFVFDEELGLLFSRMKGLGIDLEEMARSDNLFVEQVDAAELSPGEFAHRVSQRVDEDHIKPW